MMLAEVSAQENISYNGTGNYVYIERTDLRRYDNGKYTGLVSKEVHSFINSSDYDNGYIYEGNFFIHQETSGGNITRYNGIHDSIYSRFRINDDGQLFMIEDNGYPSFRSFPSYSSHKIKPGDRWEAKAERAVDPLNKGIVTKMPIYVQYTYDRDDVFHEEPVYVLSAMWATRYGMGSGTAYIDWGGDGELSKAQGSHKATILVSKKSGNALVVRDTVDETFLYADGNAISFKGTISLFTEYPPSINKDKLLPALKRLAKLSDSDVEKLNDREKSVNDFKSDAGKSESLLDSSEKIASSHKTDSMNDEKSFSNNSSIESEKLTKTEQKNNLRDKIRKNITTSDETDLLKIKDRDGLIDGNGEDENEPEILQKITVANTPAGIRLTMQNLQFKADSAELLPGEKENLDQIAEVLKLVPESQFLIEGHTASTGRTAGEKQLSLERAHSIAKELARRGIQESRFICRGSGGTKPVAENNTAEGRARNRRVEITILE